MKGIFLKEEEGGDADMVTALARLTNLWERHLGVTPSQWLHWATSELLPGEGFQGHHRVFHFFLQFDINGLVFEENCFSNT